MPLLRAHCFLNVGERAHKCIYNVDIPPNDTHNQITT